MTDAPEKTRLTARELGALCGVSERTVRFYVEEGLLPPPAARGRGPNFEDSHLTRLRLIRAMQQAGNDLDTIRDYLRELEQELAARGATFESVLAVWNGRTEQAGWREHARKAWAAPDTVHRYAVAEGVELLVDHRSALPTTRMRELLRLIREAFEAEE
jgi:DNA-binding transcriptional MerR regulator